MAPPIICSLLSLDYSDNHKVQTFPLDLTKKIVELCDLSALGALAQLSNDWKNLMSDSYLWKKEIYQTLACGNNEWVKHFENTVVDSDEDFKSFPTALVIQHCKTLKAIYKEVPIRQLFFAFWIPKLFNDEPLGIETFGTSFLKKKFIEKDNGYEEINSRISKKFKDHIINSSRWVFIVERFFHFNKSSEDCKKVVDGFKQFQINYIIPSFGETMVGLLAKYIKTGRWLFETTVKTYIICHEVIEQAEISIGIESQKSLELALLTDRENEDANNDPPGINNQEPEPALYSVVIFGRTIVQD